MAQRTAFLNSDAKGFNKDFHHTWINNYMLKQPGVMFSNYTTKPEFALGNGQISGGKAIIRCTRTTGTFAGEEILACFESTSTENISTAGNKKVYIEIPEVYVNDSTAITDSLTQGANLNVGRIVSSDSYPTHSNYIPLWEITNGDWQNATDLRPEVLRRGKPNTLSYFGGNGEEERIDIDNASLNKYLMSNGAGVAPSWEEGGGGGGGSGENFKRTFTADEDLLAKSMFGVEVQGGLSDVDSSIAFGKTTATKVFFPIVINGEDFNSIVLNLKAVNSPSDSLSVRIETLDTNGQPSGTLVDVGAYGTVSPTGTATDTTINLSGTVTGLTAHTKAAVVLERSGTTSDSNYYELGCVSGAKVISQIYVNNGTIYSAVSHSGCVSCDGFATEAVVQATSLNGVEWTGYCETGATAGNDFTGILQGTVDYTGATTGTKYYLTSTGVLGTSGAPLVGYGVEDGVLKIESGTTINGETGALSMKTINSQPLIGSGNIQIEGQKTFDAIVAADGTGDYTSVKAALGAFKSRIFVKNGTYNHQNEYWDAEDTDLNDVYIEGESTKGVIINFSSTTGTTSSNRAFIRTRTGGASSAHSFVLKNMTINVAADGGNAGSSGPYNALFKDSSLKVSEDRLWRVENCVFNFDTASGGACLTYGFSIGDIYQAHVTQYPKLKSGFFGCEIHFESGCYYNFALSTQPYNLDVKDMAFDRCIITNHTSIVTGLQSCIFYGCDINVDDAGISGIKLYDTGLQCDNAYRGFTADTVGGQDSTYYYISTLYNSRLSASTTVQPCDYIRLGETTNSSVYFGCDTNKIVIRTDGVWSNSYIRCDENNSQVSIRDKVTGCNIDCDRIDIDTNEQITGTELGSLASGVHTMLEGIVTGCALVGNWTISGDDYYSYNGATVTGCKCKGAGQEITLDGESCVFSGNVQFNLTLILGANANRCVVTGNYINSFETLSGSSYCVITGNAFSLSSHSQGTGHVYANNLD